MDALKTFEISMKHPTSNFVTDGRTDGQMDGRTGRKVAYGVAQHATKNGAETERWTEESVLPKKWF